MNFFDMFFDLFVKLDELKMYEYERLLEILRNKRDDPDNTSYDGQIIKVLKNITNLNKYISVVKKILKI